MSMASVKTIRRTACILGALSVLILSGVLWSDRYTGFDPNRTMSVREAWDAGLIQGFIVLHLLLGVSALGVWQLHSWARWLAYFWFPLLATNNLATEFWHTGSVQTESWLQAAVLSAIWLGALYPRLASHQASEVFRGGRST